MSGIGSPFARVLGPAQCDGSWAYERLWSAFAPAVVAYLRLRGAADPEDLTSEVFLGAFRGIGRFSGGEDQFRAWLFTIAHRPVVDDRRRAAVRPQWTVDGTGSFDRWGGDAEDDALRRLADSRVRELCDRLPPAQRDVLLLRLVADLTVDQVAAALARTPGAVKALQRRGLGTLRHALEREGVPL